mmetsp:Transcript_74420/g.222027  ORF Transcript_74420/g.222027 Transcript_74420/m.222027 type:complete len:296 (+) Transcript_74420:279-1166(+)
MATNGDGGERAHEDTTGGLVPVQVVCWIWQRDARRHLRKVAARAHAVAPDLIAEGAGHEQGLPVWRHCKPVRHGDAPGGSAGAGPGLLAAGAAQDAQAAKVDGQVAVRQNIEDIEQVLLLFELFGRPGGLPDGHKHFANPFALHDVVGGGPRNEVALDPAHQIQPEIPEALALDPEYLHTSQLVAMIDHIQQLRLVGEEDPVASKPRRRREAHQLKLPDRAGGHVPSLNHAHRKDAGELRMAPAPPEGGLEVAGRGDGDAVTPERQVLATLELVAAQQLAGPVVECDVLRTEDGV